MFSPYAGNRKVGRATVKASYFVMAVCGENITVVPDVAGSCATCKKECAKRNPGFTVINSKGFDLQPGDKVKIGSFSPAESVRNFLSIALPLVFAVAGYFVPSIFSDAPQTAHTDAIRAGCATSFLILGALVIFLFSRLRPPQKTLEITSKL